MAHLRGRRVDSVIDELITLAGEQRSRSIAEVRVARPLDPDQAERLQAALSRIHGRDVRLNVAVDPDVIGGISVRIGSEVVDATVATRFEQARRALVG
jgi:F-type H+-transporting ATPase subunit delta